MKQEDLLDAIGEVKDEYIQEARSGKKMPRWAKWTSAIAACLVLALGINIILDGMGGSAGGGGDNDLNYMNYIGPVLPLTIQGENKGISAVRNVNFDFSPYTSSNGRYRREAIVTDSYVLTNESETDQTVTLRYPQTGSLYDYANEGMYPAFTVNGQAITAGFHPGPYTGSFQGAWGDNHEAETLNLKVIENFEGYQVLLSDGSYQASTFDEFPVLDQEVIVYRLSDYVYSKDESAPNPTIEIAFPLDYEKTYVFTYGMNIGPMGERNGVRTCRKGSIEYNPDLPEYFREPKDAYVILMGEDIDGYFIQGYRDGNCHEGEELDDMSCKVTRYESTLGAVLYEAVQDYMEHRLPLRFSKAVVGSTEQYCALAADVLETHGILGKEPAGHYAWGDIESLIDATHTDPRVMYFSFDVTIPAGKQITVEATMVKDASIAFSDKYRGKDGYDMATRLGSNLTFTEQTASISGCGEMEIVGQNFGFDLTNDITSVTLDLEQDHYWMEIRKAR